MTIEDKQEEKKKEPGVLKLTAFYSGESIPKGSVNLSDMSLPITEKIDGYVSCLYGHQAMNRALGELIRGSLAENKKYFTATVTYQLKNPLPIGVANLLDVVKGNVDFLNLSRIRSDVIKDIGGFFRDFLVDQTSKSADELDEHFKGFTRVNYYLPSYPELTRLLFERYKHVNVIVHPVRFTSTEEDDCHYIATFRISNRIKEVVGNDWECKELPEKIIIA